jgi:hypothetical protein
MLAGSRVATSQPQEYGEVPREVYSPWSSWSQCNSRCEQKRERHCLHAATCGNARHKVNFIIVYKRVKVETQLRPNACSKVEGWGNVRRRGFFYLYTETTYKSMQ